MGDFPGSLLRLLAGPTEVADRSCLPTPIGRRPPPDAGQPVPLGRQWPDQSEGREDRRVPRAGVDAGARVELSREALLLYCTLAAVPERSARRRPLPASSTI
jgi:hypothetical protein